MDPLEALSVDDMEEMSLCDSSETACYTMFQGDAIPTLLTHGITVLVGMAQLVQIHLLAGRAQTLKSSRPTEEPSRKKFFLNEMLPEILAVVLIVLFSLWLCGLFGWVLLLSQCTSIHEDSDVLPEDL